MESSSTTAQDRAARYVASLRPAMHGEARRIAQGHLDSGTQVDHARAILAALDAR